jgi:hypothetical protein
MLWGGFALALVGLPSYFLFFVRYQNTREFPWVNFLLFALSSFMLGVGIQRAYSRPQQFRGKVAGPILAVLSFALLVLFVVSIYWGARTPASLNAPQLGQVVPDFTLPDSEGQSVTLSSLLRQPFSSNDWPATAAGTRKASGAVLIFYRGYW